MRKEIMKIRAETSEVENKPLIVKINKRKHWFIGNGYTSNKANQEKKEHTNLRISELKRANLTKDHPGIKSK